MPGSVPISFSNSLPISSLFICTAGSTMWLGFTCISCTILSPRSLSTVSMPFPSRNGFSAHSSASIDLLFMNSLTPWSLRIFSTVSRYSCASFAQCTVAPFFMAFSSNSVSSSARWLLEYIFRAHAASLSCSHSGSVLLIRSLFCLTIHSVWSCHRAFPLSFRNSAAANECFVLISDVFL